jgi:phosphoglycerate dehydrogenase-like enzyme
VRWASSAKTSPPLRIAVMGSEDDNALTVLKTLPAGAEVVRTTLSPSSADKELLASANVLLCAGGNATTLAPFVQWMPNLAWIHSLFAGIDHLACPQLQHLSPNVVLTNAKGVFSSTLAEYVMAAVAHFNKDIPRLQRQKEGRLWDRYLIGEIRGKTMGIVGYGDIGMSTARLARAYGMRIIGLRKRPEMSSADPFLDECVGLEKLDYLMGESDFVVVAAPLTQETKGLIGEHQFRKAKKGSVLINIGRGPVIDEHALCSALREGILGGAALDVFCEEPLPSSSELWETKNLLISPHNADLTPEGRHQSVQLFVRNCELYLEKGIQGLECVIDAKRGY